MANVATVHILNHLCVHWIALSLAKDDQVEVVQLINVADSQEQILESLSRKAHHPSWLPSNHKGDQ